MPMGLPPEAAEDTDFLAGSVVPRLCVRVPAVRLSISRGLGWQQSLSAFKSEAAALQTATSKSVSQLNAVSVAIRARGTANSGETNEL